MDNSTRTPTQGSNTAYPDWFMQSAPPPQPPHKDRRWAVVIVVVVLLLTLMTVAVIFAKPEQELVNSCLSPEDYVEISGNTVLTAPFDPKIDFYGSSFAFSANSADHPPEEVQNVKDEINKIAAFYKKHSPIKPMAIKLTAPQMPETKDNLAQSRLDIIKKLLLNAGVLESDISSSITSHQQTGPEDGRLDGTDYVSIQLVSQLTCK